jgi:hypothetical protein
MPRRVGRIKHSVAEWMEALAGKPQIELPPEVKALPKFHGDHTRYMADVCCPKSPDRHHRFAKYPNSPDCCHYCHGGRNPEVDY